MLGVELVRTAWWPSDRQASNMRMEERNMNFKPYELLYWEADRKRTTRAVESFRSKPELLKRRAELKAIPEKTFVFPGWDKDGK